MAEQPELTPGEPVGPLAQHMALVDELVRLARLEEAEGVELLETGAVHGLVEKSTRLLIDAREHARRQHLEGAETLRADHVRHLASAARIMGRDRDRIAHLTTALRLASLQFAAYAQAWRMASDEQEATRCDAMAAECASVVKGVAGG